MEIRLLVAFALMGLVLFLTPLIYKPAKPPEKQPAPAVKVETKQPAETAPPEAKAESKPAPKSPAARKSAPTPPPETVAAAKEQTYAVETDLYKVVFSNRGAVVRSWQLKKYKDQQGQPVDVAVRPEVGVQKTYWPLAYYDYKGATVTADLNQALFQVTQPDPLTVEFRFSDGRTTAAKTFRFDPQHYKTAFSSEVLLDGRSLAHRLQWRGGFGDRTAHSAAATQRTLYFDTVKGKLEVNDVKAGKNGPVGATGTFSFAGIEDTFFAAILVPPPGANLEYQAWTDVFDSSPEHKDESHAGITLAGDASLTGTLFVGPKEIDTLRGVDPKLEQLVDFGWFWFIAKPLFLAMHWTQEHLIENWGWVIVFITVIINFLMLPLRFSSLRSQKKMQAIQPELAKINAKYKDIPMRDPRKQKQQEEMMALYSKHGINPAGGCVPLLLQMPFFFAFYKVLTVVIELRGAPWLWVPDLSQPEPGFLRWLPILMLITQVVMQKMTPPTPGADPNQMRMMMLMPLILFIPFYQASAGLVLYWLAGNVIGIIQQYFFNKAAHKPVPAPAGAGGKKDK